MLITHSLHNCIKNQDGRSFEQKSTGQCTCIIKSLVYDKHLVFGQTLAVPPELGGFILYKSLSGYKRCKR